jgi:hypothetical protein
MPFGSIESFKMSTCWCTPSSTRDGFSPRRGDETFDDLALVVPTDRPAAWRRVSVTLATSPT